MFRIGWSSVDGGVLLLFFVFFFFQAEDGIRDLVRSRGLGDVYKRQVFRCVRRHEFAPRVRVVVRCIGA